ncbi:hypothetical protein BRC96_10480 [Halobacteriales archaeon QS_6_64_34]|nr:MAG: hypothetical protein BRC96_10480 [Halobacteriales archaeon QS_6_64_34]
MVFIGTKTRAEQRALNVENQRAVVNQTSHSHTKGLDIDKEALRAIIKGTLTLVDDVHETYEKWVSERLTAEDVISLLNTGQLADSDLPGWMQDLTDSLDGKAEKAEESGEVFGEESQKQYVQAEMDSVSKWDAYNDITEEIWHRGESNDSTRQSKMRALHRTFEPAPDAGVTLRWAPAVSAREGL